MSKGKRSIANVKGDIVLDALYASATEFSGKEPVVAFIDALLTENEKKVIGRRILIAQMILAGKTRMEISNVLGVSPNTIALTRKWLEAVMPRYSETLQERAAIAQAKKVARTKTRKQYKQYADPSTFRGLRQRYPMHFLLFNLAEELLIRISK